MTTYNNYEAYKRVVDSGRRNVRFVSLLDHSVSTSNPVTTDTGVGVNAFRGVAGCSV